MNTMCEIILHQIDNEVNMLISKMCMHIIFECSMLNIGHGVENE